MIETKVKVLFHSGLHARPASILVKKASGFTSEVALLKGEKKVNAKSIIGVMSLAATKGSEVTLCIEGNDEQHATNELIKFFSSDVEA
ncbi:HPr family phosphocarrier protein [Neobacillus sp. MM2021_6]|uniref:HPr family phosphocarrier protein n=1 Tax=Bacillaceae TaxID=186817 RepID=UPI001409EE53|nr:MULTISPECIES: HPr family phosphocarrier protein [Bacillaceae]MBO0958671.1 HPr family phosphocarrier protein [Neobacillus sp. MM2021_6]NHC20189.1 HPr family phosphocarrier protein [Bacillus sp. MM2020_4]